MSPRRVSLAMTVGVLLAVTGCAGSRQPNAAAAPPPLPPGGGAPLLTNEQIAAARKLYIAKCTACHKYYPPADYSATDWETWMRKMSRKARLKPPEDQTLREYLSLYRQSP